MIINIINFNFNKKDFNNKRKRVKKALFNIFALEKNNYFNINYIFIKELNFNIYFLNIILNNYNIFDIIN